VANVGAAYAPSERLFTNRVAGDIERAVEALEQHLWNCG
jgi:hypothetical protein